MSIAAAAAKSVAVCSALTKANLSSIGWVTHALRGTRAIFSAA
jgi:hypothetical protein